MQQQRGGERQLGPYWTVLFYIGLFPASFSCIFQAYSLLIQLIVIHIAYDWIRTKDLGFWKQLRQDHWPFLECILMTSE